MLLPDLDNFTHWKHENKLAYEILNWGKLKKTWKVMEILRQAVLYVKDIIIIYQEIHPAVNALFC